MKPGGSGREIEFKLGLASEEALDALLRALGPAARPSPPVLQVNHFFDTLKSDLGRHGIALRLREEDGCFALTAKGRSRTRAALTVRDEHELALDAATARAILEGRLSPLQVLLERAPRPLEPLLEDMRVHAAERPLVELGAFENERRRVASVSLPTEEGPLEVVLELDRTRFPGDRIEREVEVEIADPGDVPRAERALRALLASAGIPWTPAASKAGRFFRYLLS